ncbi:hypothetical protein B0J13DRAFT_530821 [Dactylonectria estremocensis]|uniref:Uncharacterized protein n=1 Tax=Dactylonectria estremocensis TaxID=1079267 RepID=A0A9P9DXH1_9HYPO|nr:hypothetical protein B0J13DRAFT_530821 [Dactylonectria estremocensis]
MCEYSPERHSAANAYSIDNISESSSPVQDLRMSNPGHNQGQGVPTQYVAAYHAHVNRDDDGLQDRSNWLPNGTIAQAVSYTQQEHHSPLYVSDDPMGTPIAMHGYVADPNSRGFAARDQRMYGVAAGRDSYGQAHTAVSSAWVDNYTDGQQNHTDGTDGAGLHATPSASPSSTLTNYGSWGSTIQAGGIDYCCQYSSRVGSSHGSNVANHSSAIDQFLASSSGSEVRDALQLCDSLLSQDRGPAAAAVAYPQEIVMSSSESDDEMDNKHGEVSQDKSKRKANSKAKPKSSKVKRRSTLEGKKKNGKNEKESRK